jgi:hypothetical protein
MKTVFLAEIAALKIEVAALKGAASVEPEAPAAPKSPRAKKAD